MGKGKRYKAPKLVTKPQVPAPQTQQISTNDQKPIFNLEHLRGDYCLSRCTTEEKAAFADRLWKLSQLTWGEIQNAPRHGLGTEIIPREALGERAYPADLSPDVPILAFRCWGKAPFLGYRADRIFTVLILDPKMTAYDHG